MIAQQTNELDREESRSAQRADASGPVVGQEGHDAAASPPQRAARLAADPASLGSLGGIEVRAAVELGAAELLLRDLAALGHGSVVRLDRLVNEPAELTVNGRLFARGDLVVVGDHLGLRITEVIGARYPSGDRA